MRPSPYVVRMATADEIQYLFGSAHVKWGEAHVLWGSAH